MTRWQRLKYTIVQPDDSDDEKASPTNVPSRSSRTPSGAPTTRSGPSAWWPPRWPPSSASSSARPPSDYAKNHHQSTTVYDELTYVILAMSVLILVSSLLRKRLFQGITLALYGLAVFNLRFWGFGIPFLLAGAWYLVRAYRLQQALKRAEADAPGPPRPNGRPAERTAHGRGRTSATRRPPEARSTDPLRRGAPPAGPRVGSARCVGTAAATPPGRQPPTSTRITNRTAGRMKTPSDACSESDDGTGETRPGRRARRRRRTVAPGAWNVVARAAARRSGGRRACRCPGTSSRRRCCRSRRGGPGSPTP